MTRSILASSTPLHSETLGGSFKDPYQRVAGLKIQRSECDMVHAASDTTAFTYDCEPGHYYCIRIFRTRAGKPHGPQQGTQFFTSPVERDKYLTRKIRDFWKSERRREDVTRMGNKARR